MAAYDDNNPITHGQRIKKKSKHISTQSSSGLFANAIKEGWVLKKGPQTLAGWKKRYLQLSAKHQLGYYTDDSMVCKKGTIFLKSLTIHHIKRSSKTSDSKHHGFCIVTKLRTYQLCVGSSTDRDHWIQKIREVVDDKWDAHKIEKPSISYSSPMTNTNANAFSTNMNTNGKGSDKPLYGYNDNAYGDWEEDDIESEHTNATLKIKQNMLRESNESNDGMKSKYGHRNESGNGQILLTEKEAQTQIKILEHKNDTLLDQALQTTNETQKMATDTAVMLDGQRGQLIGIDKTLHEIDGDLDRTEGILDGMKSWKGMIKRKFRKNKGNEREEYESVVSGKSAFKRNGNERKDMESMGNNGVNVSAYESDNKQNEKLDELLGNLKALNATAKDINIELDEQDAIINSISDKMDKVQPKMQQQNNTMKKICQ